MHRNRILNQNTDWQYIMMPVGKHRIALNTLIKDVFISEGDQWKKKILSQLIVYKKIAPFYQDIYNSLTREPSIYPFRQFFLKRMENKQRWVLWQKGFSLLGLVAVIAADVLVVWAYLT